MKNLEISLGDFAIILSINSVSSTFNSVYFSIATSISAGREMFLVNSVLTTVNLEKNSFTCNLRILIVFKILVEIVIHIRVIKILRDDFKSACQTLSTCHSIIYRHRIHWYVCHNNYYPSRKNRKTTFSGL